MKKVTFINGPLLPPRKGRAPKYDWGRIKKNRPMRVTGVTSRGFSSTVYSAAKARGVRFSIRTIDANTIDVHYAGKAS